VGLLCNLMKVWLYESAFKERNSLVASTYKAISAMLPIGRNE
jgi:hypothetical protein